MPPFYFNYLLTRLRDLENLIQKSSPKIPMGEHQAHQDRILSELKGQLSESIGAKIKAARARSPGIYHYQYSDVEPTQISYEEASVATGYAVSTLRMRLSHHGGSTSFWKQGRWQVLSRTKDPEAVQRALQLAFKTTGSQDDLRQLSPRGKF